MAVVLADNDKYEVLEVIGRGAFGIIRKVRRKTDGEILCRKEINYLKMSQKERDQLSAEFNILSSLKHPNIVGYYHREHLRHSQELYMYMEYCGGGDLGTVIRELKQKDKLAKEDFVWRILSQLLTALYRCHYGIDPPEPGDSARPKEARLLPNTRTNPMILHRDLKPENIFLDGDKSVKLGDFGLSKIMQSHDFASTYVGTPFYMSPEICAAEKYTLKSDIWAVGCIIYELCTKEPPFNANSHLQLVNKIRKGDIAPLPREYSKELGNLVKSCLSTNPTYRPDTETLLHHPSVWLARKQSELVSLSRSLRYEKEVAEQRASQAECRVAELEAGKIAIRAELEAQIRREWEVKARLEIDRQVEIEYQQKFEVLRSHFDNEVNRKVTDLMSKHTCNVAPVLTEITNLPASTISQDIHNHHSSTNTSQASEWTNTTDLTELSDLSISSPPLSTTRPVLTKKTKTPFTRSRTTIDSPADVQMSEPSPMSISSLNLSPRRNATETNPLTGKHLFTKIANNRARMAFEDDFDGDKENLFVDSDDDDDGVPDLPSPTRPKQQNTDPFKVPAPVNPLRSKARPGFLRQNTIATTTKLVAKPNLFPTTGVSATSAQVRAGILAANPNSAQQSQIPRSSTESDVRARSNSPTHKAAKRLTKIPSRNDLANDNTICMAGNTGSTSPLRRAATTSGTSGPSTKLQSKLAGARNDAGAMTTVAGRTKVELAQARAGGRRMSVDFGGNIFANGLKQQYPMISDKDLPPVPVWDPEVLGDEAMPSPFLKREVRMIRGLR